jgi:hypothetical protein
MARGGQKKKPEDPERKCIVTGEAGPKRGLIRFAVGPDNQVVPDVFEKLPGRGIWVLADRVALEAAIKKNLVSRSAKRPVIVPDNLIGEIERQLVKRLTDLIALSRKSSSAVAGFEKVKGWLADGKAKVLLQASDGSERGKGKLWTPEGGRFFDVLTASELGLAFGRESVIHGALATGGLTQRVVEEATRLSGLRVNDGGKTTVKEKTTT